MATQLIPDQDPNQNPTNISIQPPINQPTNQDNDRLARLESMVGSLVQTNTDLQNRLAEQARVQSTPQTHKFTYDQFMEDPAEHLNRLIAQQTAPLNNAVATMTRQANYSNLRNLVSSHPQVAPHWNKISGFVDGQLMPLLQQRDVTQNDFQAVIYQALGALAIQGGLNSPQNSNPNPNPVPPNGNENNPGNPGNVNQNSMVIPPNPRSSVSPLPNNQQAPRARQLNELEKRVARENKQSDLQYLYWNGEITEEAAKQIDSNFRVR